MATDTTDLTRPDILAAHLSAQLATAARAHEDVAERRAAAALDVTLGLAGAKRRYKALNGEFEGTRAAIRRLREARKRAAARRAEREAEAARAAHEQRRQGINALVDERRAAIARAEKQMTALLASLRRADDLAQRIIALRGPVADVPANVHPDGLGPVPARERIRRAAVGMGLGEWLSIKAHFIDASRPVTSLRALEEPAMSLCRIAGESQTGTEAAA